MTPGEVAVVRQAVRNHRNVLISGGMGSGKSTLANAILAEVTNQYPGERILVLEDTVELQVSSQNVVQYRTSAQVDLRRLLRTTLRMRGDRIIIGEVRGGEALDLLVAWNLGHPGGLSTLHANSAAEALLRLEMLVDMHPDAPRNIPRFITEARPVIVHITRNPERGRVVRELLEVTGFGPDGYQAQAF